MGIPESVTDSLCYLNENSQGEMKAQEFPYALLHFRKMKLHFYLLTEADKHNFALRLAKKYVHYLPTSLMMLS